MSIVGVFPSNSFSLVPLPWKIPLEEQHPAEKCSKSLELCTSVRRYIVLSSHFRPCDVLPESCFQFLSHPRAYVCKTYNKRQIPLSCVQTDGTLLDVTCWVRLHTLLHVVGGCWELLAEKFDWFQTLRNKAQQHPTKCNRVCKRTQRVTSNNVGSCWPRMLRPFARSLREFAFC